MSGTADIFDAVIAGDAAAVSSILERDTDAARQRNADGLTPVMVAVYRGQNEILALLLAEARDLDVFEAAAVGNEPRLSELIAADAKSVSARAPDGFTPLHLAAYFGQEGAVRTLLAHGANVGAVATNPGITVQPLHSAVSSGHRAIAGLLIAAGADVNAVQRGGYTPLHGAAYNGDVEMIELLLSAGAQKTPRTDDGKSAEDLAREQGHPAAADLVRA